MSSEIVVALITGACTLLGAGITAVSGLALIRYRLRVVESKIDEHNGYAKMYTEAHEDILLIKKDMEYLKDKVNDLSERSKK